MPFEVRLPDIGEGVAEGEIVRWLVKAGESVREDQPLVEVMTDKATVEIPSPRTGVVGALLVAEGKTVPVGTVIVTIEVGSGAASTAASPGARASAAAEVQLGTTTVAGGTHASAAHGATRSAPAAAPAYGPLAPSEPTHATPAVRTLARQLGVRLDGMRGSGPGGRIVKDDVQRASSGATPPMGAGGRATAAGGGAAAPARATSAPAGGPEERVAVRGLRRRIAEAMRHSLDTAAHFTFVAECDMTAVVEHRAGLKARASAQGVSLTYLAYVVKALAEPLRQYPLLNASLDEGTQEVVLKRYYHLGVATATTEGLTVPVVRDIDRLSLFGIANEIARLAAAARAHRLKLDELQGGTFTVTSTGAHGGLLATPIIHHPQVAILGVHEVKKRPAVVDDRVVARDMTNLSLSLDHRVVDGAVGADFLYALIARLQEPGAWLSEAEIA